MKVTTKNHNVNFYEILSKTKNKKIRKSLLLSLEIIHYNNITIKNLSKIRSHFIDDYPNNEVILEAQKRLFDTSKKRNIKKVSPSDSFKYLFTYAYRKSDTDALSLKKLTKI